MVSSARIVVSVVSVLALAAGAAGQSADPKVDELLARSFEARGGLDRIKQMTTLRMNGRIESNGQTIEMTTLSKRPNLMRQEMTVMGQKLVSAFDGSRMWAINPMTGSSDPQVVPGSQAQSMKEQADFDGPLVDYQSKGNKVEYAGADTVNNRKTHRLKVTIKGGATVTVDLDAETFLEVRLSRDMETGAGRARMETYMADYRPVSGLMLPHAIRNVVNGKPQAQVTIEKIEVDVPLDDALFRMPKR